MPAKQDQNPEPKDEGKELESPVNQPEENATVTEPPVREITQTDRINKRLLVSLLENMNKGQFFDMGNATGSGPADSTDNADADWK